MAESWIVPLTLPLSRASIDVSGRSNGWVRRSSHARTNDGTLETSGMLLRVLAAHLEQVLSATT